MPDLPESTGSCVLPSALDDLLLIAAMDGEARSEIASHLRICQSCAERVRMYIALQRYLRQQLYRLFCPTSDELRAFQHGELEYKHATKLSEHVRTCPHCARELRFLTNMAASSSPAEPTLCA